MIRALGQSVRLVGRMCFAVVLGLLLLTASATAQVPGGQPKVGGALRAIYWTPLSTLNRYFVQSPGTARFSELTLDGLARLGPDGFYVPELAAEIPTQTNGDVSSDGTVVTWKLKPGVLWSDGQPFTSQDVVYTYQMIMDPANPVVDRGDYAVMESVVARDDDTVVVTYKQLYAPYRLAFPSVFPAHVFNGQTNIAADAFNLGPTVGTGPFIYKSGSVQDTLTVDRNPNYRESRKPYLDEVVVRFTPDRDTEVPALQAGDVDAAIFLAETTLPQLATMSDTSVEPAPSPSVNMLVLNSSCSGGARQGDPACTNPVLGDVRVRQAIELAVDKQAIVHGVLGDVDQVANSLLPVGPYESDIPPAEFSPDKAQQLLDQAGWVVGSDGIRNRGGVRAHLVLLIGSGGSISPLVAQVVQNDLQDVGIETEIKQSPVVNSGFVGGSPYNLGSFDLGFGTNGCCPTDPQAYLQSHFASNQVPNPQLQTGNNFSRIQDPQLDRALAAAGATLNDTERQANYLLVSRLIQADEAVIPLFTTVQVDARKSYVQGWGPTNVNDFVTWNSQNWWLNQ
jgi:peptide/nickel transport system substrate-binding protein